MNNASTDLRFTSLGSPNRIWAVSAIHAEQNRLTALHDAIYERFTPGDRLIYTGNYIGYGNTPCETIDELLTFRRVLLSIPGVCVNDLIYLRGGQEEMWQKLMQLQFAPNPTEILLWMLSKGLSSTLESYDVCPHDGIVASQEGVMALTSWTSKIRNAVRTHKGHDTLSTHLKRAAFTDKNQNFPMLFVHAGIDPSRSLSDQGDSFWWAGNKFLNIHVPFMPFQKVIRGFDPDHQGMNINCVTATIDGGCGFGGELVCAGFNHEGSIFEILQS